MQRMCEKFVPETGAFYFQRVLESQSPAQHLKSSIMTTDH